MGGGDLVGTDPDLDSEDKVKKGVVSEEEFRKAWEKQGEEAQEAGNPEMQALDKLFEEGPMACEGETVEKSEDMMHLDDMETVDTFLLGLVPLEFYIRDFKKSYTAEPYVEKEMRHAANLSFESLPLEEKGKYEAMAKKHLAEMERQANAPPAPSLTDMCCGARGHAAMASMGIRTGTDEVLSL